MLHQVHIASRRRSPAGLLQEFGRVPVFDVTWLTKNPRMLPLNPYYPHGEIPVAFSGRKKFGVSLESIWNGLKVFENEGPDYSVFECGNKMLMMRNEGVRNRGKLIGYQQGTHEEWPVLSEMDARRLIYAPSYKWILKKHCSEAVEFLRNQLQRVDIVLLDTDIEHHRRDPAFPIQHSVLLRDLLTDNYPKSDPSDWIPLTDEERVQFTKRRREEQAARMEAGEKNFVGGFAG